VLGVVARAVQGKKREKKVLTVLACRNDQLPKLVGVAANK